MELLTVILIPAAFMYYSAGNRFSNLPTYRMAYGTGLVCGLVLVLTNALVFASLPWNTPSIPLLYLVIFVSVVAIPFFLGPVLLNLIFLAPLQERIPRIVPQLFGILTVYLPYIMITKFPVPDIWIQILFPVIIVSLVFLVDICLKYYLHSIRLDPVLDGVLIALLPVFAALLILPVVTVFWHFCFHPLLVWIPSLAMTGFTVVMRIRKYL